MSTVTLVVAAAGLLAAPSGGRAKQLAELRIFEYPPAALPSRPPDLGALEVSPLESGEIADDFSNVGDLAWLGPVARANKVVFVGETHYSRGIHQFVHRMLFALNGFDHYALLSIEHPYSVGVALEHFLALPDDAAAERFLSEQGRELPVERETLTLVRAIRRWNARRPDRRIHIAGHDIEQEWRGALRRVVAPYLRAVAPGRERDLDGIGEGELGAKVRALTRVVAASRRPAAAAAGTTLFTREEVLAVLSNLEALLQGGRDGRPDFHRQKAIVRNLTDPARLGRFLRQGKVLLWGGSRHATTRYRDPAAASFMREGSYLAHDFPPTRGRAHSLLVWSLALSVGEAAGLAASRCVSSDYRDIVERYRTARERGLVGKTGHHAFHRNFDPFDRLVATHATRAGDRPLRIQRVDWERLLAGGSEAEREDFRSWRQQLERHDAWVVVPRSPIVEMICP
jgi:hypothetical protein